MITVTCDICGKKLIKVNIIKFCGNKFEKFDCCHNCFDNIKNEIKRVGKKIK